MCPLSWEMLQLCATLAGLEEWCLCAVSCAHPAGGICNQEDSAWVLWKKESSAHVFILVEKQRVQEMLYLLPTQRIASLSYIPGALSSPLISRRSGPGSAPQQLLLASGYVCHCGTKVWIPSGWSCWFHCCCVASQGPVQRCKCAGSSCSGAAAGGWPWPSAAGLSAGFPGNSSWHWRGAGRARWAQPGQLLLLLLPRAGALPLSAVLRERGRQGKHACFCTYLRCIHRVSRLHLQCLSKSCWAFSVQLPTFSLTVTCCLKQLKNLFKSASYCKQGLFMNASHMVTQMISTFPISALKLVLVVCSLWIIFSA